MSSFFPRFSILITTKGRNTLMRTINSVVTQMKPGDELLVDKNDDHPQGHAGLNRLLTKATGDVILGVADDDYFVPGAFAVIRGEYAKNPDQIHVFRMKYSNGTSLWTAPEFVCGNVSPSMTAIPNNPDVLGRFGDEYNSDFDFLEQTRLKMARTEPVWHKDVVQIIELPPCRGGVAH